MLPTYQDGQHQKARNSRSRGTQALWVGTQAGATAVESSMWGGPRQSKQATHLRVFIRRRGNQDLRLHVQCRLIHCNRGLETTEPASASEWTKDAAPVPPDAIQTRERGDPAVGTSRAGPEGAVQSEARQTDKRAQAHLS